MVDRRLSKLCIAISLALIVTSLTRGANAAAAEGFDVATTLLARTYTPGLSINPTVGYGHRVWGDIESPWYGFLRPHIDGVVSPSLYEGKAGIEFFPVSILGVNLSRTFGRRFTDTRGQDCVANQCQGELDYTDLTVQAYFGAAGFFSSLRWTRTFFDAVSDQTRPIYDVGSSVLLKPAGEAGDYSTIVVGKDLSEDLAIGVLLQNADFHYSGQHQESQYLIARSNLKLFGFEDLSATLGLGRYKTDLNIAELSGILSVTYTGQAAIGLGR
ncbi:hypothetical protein BH10BDE1_BH10BDE1_32900 [soil metagenome]